MSIDILRLDRQLLRLIDRPHVGSKRRPGVALNLLNELRKQPMTLELLLETKVGDTVIKVGAQNWSEQVTKLTHQLINEWQQLVPKKLKNKRKDVSKKKTPKDNKENTENNETAEEVDTSNSEPIASTSGTSNLGVKSKGQTKSLGKGKKVTDNNEDNQNSNDENKENRPQTFKPILTKKKTHLGKPFELKIKKFKKLPPIGQMPEFSPKVLIQKRVENELNDEMDLSQPSTSKGITSKSSTSKLVVGGHQLYEKIVRKRKLERTTRMDSPRKRALTFATVSVERYVNSSLADRPRVQNLPVPYTLPIITPEDRLKIIQSRNLEIPPEGQTSAPDILPFKDEHEIELDHWRVRSAKSLNRIIPRKEHKPKWFKK